MVYDSARRRVVMFGGRGGSGLLSDTWEWDGKQWIRMSPGVSPSARSGHAMAYDSARRRVVLFGGWSSKGYLSDLWEWDGKMWNPIPAPGVPRARTDAAMAFDAALSKVILFGGYARSTYFADTFEYTIRARASFVSRGSGCPGSNRSIPLLWAETTPELGRDFVLRLKQAAPLAGTALILGVSPVNFDLTPLGAPGCVVLNNPDVLLTNVTNSSGAWGSPHKIHVPLDLNLLGGKVYAQVLVLDKGANRLGLVSSNGGLAVVDW